MAALFRGGNVPVHLAVFFLDRRHLIIKDINGLRRHNRNLPVVHIDDVPGVLDDGGHVRRNIISILPKPQNQRAVLSGCNQGIWIIGTNDSQCIRALNTPQDTPDRFQHIPALVIVEFQQLGHHLRIGIGYKCDPLAKQVLLDFQVIFNNAVMNQCNLAVFTDMGMRIDIVRLSMGRPAGVSDSKGPL